MRGVLLLFTKHDKKGARVLRSGQEVDRIYS